MTIRNSSQALLSFTGDLPQGGRAHTSVLLPPPFWPEQDASEQAGEPAKRVAREKIPSALDVLPNIPCSKSARVSLRRFVQPADCVQMFSSTCVVCLLWALFKPCVSLNVRFAGIFGWHYLSNATCRIRPHLFSTTLLVQYGELVCYTIRHV